MAAHLQQLEILFASKVGMKDLPNLSECPKLRMLGEPVRDWRLGCFVVPLPRLARAFRLPDVLSLIGGIGPGIKDNQLAVLDGKQLPDTLEWLIAAGNQISDLVVVDIPIVGCFEPTCDDTKL